MYKQSLYKIFLLVSILFVWNIPVSSGDENATNEVNVYSARQQHLIKPLLDDFSAQTGIKVNLVTGSGGALLTRLAAEGKNSPADVFITTDVAYLYRAKEKQLSQAIDSQFLQQTIPAAYRDPEQHWFGLSLRARVIFAQQGKLGKDDNLTYESLAEPRWQKQICIRSSTNIYNQSLVASMIAAHGEEKTAAWIKKLVANFARSPSGNDRDQITAAAGGLCTIAVANSYYLAIMLSGDNEQQKLAAQKMSIHWPNQMDRGTHVNLSGAFVTAATANRQHAIRLIEYLLSERMQKMYMDVNYEYPVRADLPLNDLLSRWGQFKKDPLSFNTIGQLNAAATRIMDSAGWR